MLGTFFVNGIRNILYSATPSRDLRYLALPETRADIQIPSYGSSPYARVAELRRGARVFLEREPNILPILSGDDLATSFNSQFIIVEGREGDNTWTEIRLPGKPSNDPGRFGIKPRVERILEEGTIDNDSSQRLAKEFGWKLPE